MAVQAVSKVTAQRALELILYNSKFPEVTRARPFEFMRRFNVTDTVKHEWFAVSGAYSNEVGETKQTSRVLKMAAVA